VARWLSNVPFPVENVHAVLAGAGEYFHVYFEGKLPERQVVMDFFEKASEDTFVVEQDEESRVVTARFGVEPSKRNPYGEAHRRYERMKRVVEQSLIPLHASYPIARVLIG